MATKDNSFILGMEVLVPQTEIVDNSPFSSNLDVSAYVDISDGKLLRVKAANFRITDALNLPLNGPIKRKSTYAGPACKREGRATSSPFH